MTRRTRTAQQLIDEAMTEAQLLKAVLGAPRRPGLALALGWRGYHTHRSQHSQAGFPDLCLVRARDCRLAFAELKRETAPDPVGEQAAWLADLEHLANHPLTPTVEVYLWRPSDLTSGRIAAALR